LEAIVEPELPVEALVPVDCIEVSLEPVCPLATEFWLFVVPELVVLADEP